MQDQATQQAQMTKQAMTLRSRLCHPITGYTRLIRLQIVRVIPWMYSLWGCNWSIFQSRHHPVHQDSCSEGSKQSCLRIIQKRAATRSSQGRGKQDISSMWPSPCSLARAIGSTQISKILGIWVAKSTWRMFRLLWHPHAQTGNWQLLSLSSHCC